MRTLIASTVVLALSAAPAFAQDLPPLETPEIDDSVIALGSSLELVAASASLNSSGQLDNGVDDEVTNLALSLATRYFRGFETAEFGYSVIASGADSMTRGPSPGGSLIINTLSLDAQPEARYYPVANSPLFVHSTVDAAFAVSSTIDTGDADTSDSSGPGRIAVAVGVGAGRIIAIDPVVRVRRLEMAMQSEGLLAGPIAPATGTAIIRDWYALRNDYSDYRRLAYAVQNLRAAGLTGEPGLRAGYKARSVIADPFVVNRRRGWDARGGFGVVQPFTSWDDTSEPDPSFALLASGQYELPIDTEQQLSLRGKALFDIGDSSDAGRPWSARAFATFTRVFYNQLFDALGAITLDGSAGISGIRLDSPVVDPPATGLDVTGSLAYSRAINRGSFATMAVNASLFNDGSFLFGVSLGLTHGIASGYYTPYYSGALVQP